MIVFGRREKKSIEEQKLAVISVIQHLRRELGMMNCGDYPQIINMDDNALPPQDIHYDDLSVSGNR